MSYIKTDTSVAVAVAAGAGSGAFNATGTLRRVAVTVPLTGGPYTYDLDIVDKDDFGVWGIAGLSGNRTLFGLDEPIDYTNTVRLTNVLNNGAPADGVTFSVRPVYEQKGRAL